MFTEAIIFFHNKQTMNLIIAINDNDYSLAQDAIAHGANINYSNKNIIMPIYAMNIAHILYNDDFKICYLLVDSGVNVNVKDTYNCSLLYGAVLYGDIRLIRYLYIAGLNPFDCDNKLKKSPMDIALLNQFYDAIIIMIEHLKPDIKQIYLNYILLKYIESKNLGGINYVIGLGADARKPFFNGKSVYDIVSVNVDLRDMLQYV